jgi:hypothetical protein
MQSQDDLSRASENVNTVPAGNRISTFGDRPTNVVDNSQSRSLTEPLRPDSPTISSTTESERGPKAATDETLNWSAAKLMINGRPDSFQFIKMDIASSPEEVIFVLEAENFGIEHAVTAARAFHWKCERPLEVIRKLTGKDFSLEPCPSQPS